jgi:hypothetical protein
MSSNTMRRHTLDLRGCSRLLYERRGAYCLISGAVLPCQASKECGCGMIGLVDSRSWEFCCLNSV